MSKIVSRDAVEMGAEPRRGAECRGAGAPAPAPGAAVSVGFEGVAAARPDLTGLARGTAARVEMLAAHAATHLATRINLVRSLLAAAEGRTPYRDELAAERRMWEEALADAKAFEAAARRVRLAPLSEAERARLAEAREKRPDDLPGAQLDALLLALPADPLDLAGLRLDAARAELTRFVSSPAPDEAAFGRAEAALEAARGDYRRLLAERAGQDADIVEARLSA